MYYLVDYYRDAAEIRAAVLGHRLGPWERGHISEVLAECSACGYFAVVNSSSHVESHFYGASLEVACQGADTIPSWLPQLPTKETQRAA